MGQSNNNVSLVRVEACHIESIWDSVKDFIKGIIDKATLGERSLQDMKDSLLCNHEDLWLLLDKEDVTILGVWITQLVSHPQYTVLNVPWAGAKEHTIDRWVNYVLSDSSPLVIWAKENNAVRIECPVRRGWLKYLNEDTKFKYYYTVVTRDV